MTTTISAYQFTREYPTGKRNEWQAVTEYSLIRPSQDDSNATEVSAVEIELVAEGARAGTYRDASWNVQAGDAESINELCILIPPAEYRGFNRGYQAFTLGEAMEQGHARVAQ